jgi:hypothetical protein
MSVFVVIVLFPESAHRTEWQTGPWQPSIRSLAARQAGILDREVKQFERRIVIMESCDAS